MSLEIREIVPGNVGAFVGTFFRGMPHELELFQLAGELIDVIWQEYRKVDPQQKAVSLSYSCFVSGGGSMSHTIRKGRH